MLHRRLLLITPLALALACGEDTPCELAGGAPSAGCSVELTGGAYPLTVEAGVTYQAVLSTADPRDFTVSVVSGGHAQVQANFPLAQRGVVSWTALADEVVTVEVSAQGVAVPVFDLSVVELSRSDDHSARLAEATPLAVGEPQDGQLERLGDADLFRFPARAGVVYRIHVEGPAVPALLGRDGAWLLPNDTFSTRVWRAVGDEDLVVGVMGGLLDTGDDVGAYTVRVDAIEARPHGRSARSASALTAGQCAGGVMEAGEQAWFAIDVVAGETVSVRVLAATEMRVLRDDSRTYAVIERAELGERDYQRVITITSAETTTLVFALMLPGTAASWQPYGIEYVSVLEE